MKNFIFLSSLGFMMLSPIFVSIYIALYLKDRYKLSDKVIIFAILFGVFCGAISLYKAIMKKG